MDSQSPDKMENLHEVNSETIKLLFVGDISLSAYFKSSFASSYLQSVGGGERWHL